MSLRPAGLGIGAAACFSPFALGTGGFNSGGAYQREPAPSAGTASRTRPPELGCEAVAQPKSASFKSARCSGMDKPHNNMFSGFTSWCSIPQASRCSKASSNCRIRRPTSSSGSKSPFFLDCANVSKTVELSQNSKTSTSSLSQSSKLSNKRIMFGCTPTRISAASSVANERLPTFLKRLIATRRPVSGMHAGSKPFAQNAGIVDDFSGTCDALAIASAS
mmetsp:Transcript_34657/g.55196  ORF Transcript_34657/g.55196 Transcript_34657/m.55196 type:complete len:220 (+) Transcript_34657:467-1126(+)